MSINEVYSKWCNKLFEEGTIVDAPWTAKELALLIRAMSENSQYTIEECFNKVKPDYIWRGGVMKEARRILKYNREIVPQSKKTPEGTGDK
jgi:hypothetical protein